MSRRSSLSRRRFLRLGAGGSVALASAGALGPGPWSMLSARTSAAAGGDDYRALVCVFLLGGADSANLIVPRSEEAYATYAASRKVLAVSRETLLPITPLTGQGADYGLHSMVPELAQRFDEGSLAFVANVGPLVQPITKEQFPDKSVPRPARLFSHNDQQLQRQLAYADSPHGRGWGGRIADRVSHVNGETPLPMNISLGGRVPMLMGETSFPYSMSAAGSESLLAMEPGSRRREVFDALLESRGHILEDGYSRTQREAMEIDALVSNALDSAPSFQGLFPVNVRIAEQLRMVAQLISVRGALEAKRQIFFVAMEGFDTHMQQNTLLPPLFRDLSRSLDAFQRALESIGAASSVTTFTSSEFGRTLSSNSSGSDHGWGNHAMVLGANVRGGDIYGTMPDLTLDGPDDLGGGRIIPTLSEDQYAATLARWFGLSEPVLGTVFPNLAKFSAADLGFLA